MCGLDCLINERQEADFIVVVFLEDCRLLSCSKHLQIEKEEQVLKGSISRVIQRVMTKTGFHDNQALTMKSLGYLWPREATWLPPVLWW